MRKRNPVHLPRLPLEGCERKRVAMLLAELLEATMLICFGLSWPMNAWKSYRARTAKGTSWQFLTLICLGYLCGIAAKIALGAMNWVFWIYVLNLAFLGINWVIYFRNRRFDAERAGPVCLRACLRRYAEHLMRQLLRAIVSFMVCAAVTWDWQPAGASKTRQKASLGW